MFKAGWLAKSQKRPGPWSIKKVVSDRQPWRPCPSGRQERGTALIFQGQVGDVCMCILARCYSGISQHFGTTCVFSNQ